MLLREGLDLSSTGALRRMASVHGLVHDDATTRDELVERLAERLLDPTYLDEQLAGLAKDERATLVAARASGGELRGLLIERDHPGASDALIERGLLFRIFAAAGPLRGEVFEAPQEILARLPAPPAVDAPRADEAPPAERRSSDPAFSLLALVSALTRAGGQLEDEVRPWCEEPGGWDWEARWIFLRHLAQSAGLLVHQADGALAPGPALARLLDDPPALLERLWRTYLQDRGWSELDRAREELDRAREEPDRADEGSDRAYQGADRAREGPDRARVAPERDRAAPERDRARAASERGQELADTVLLRKALVDAVQALPEGAWIALDAFSDWLRAARPVAVREQLNARGIVLMESVSWADLERPLLRYALLGPMYWLGVIGASVDGRYVVRRAGALSSDSATPRQSPLASPAPDSPTPSPGRLAPPGPDWPMVSQGRPAPLGPDSLTPSQRPAAPRGPDSPMVSQRPAAPLGPDSPMVSQGRLAPLEPDSPTPSQNRPSPLGPDSPIVSQGRLAPLEPNSLTPSQRPAAPLGPDSAMASQNRPAPLGPDSQVASQGRLRPRPAAEPCTWEATADFVAPPRASLGTLLQAERYLVLRERGRPSRYHLVQSHVAAALASGGSIAECRRLLRKLTQGPLPLTVDERLAAWEQRFGAVGVRPAVLVEARTAAELDEAIADERVRRFVRARLGPTVAEVPAADVLELAAALRAGGHLPRVDAALRLAAEPRRAYAGLIDEQVLEFLLVGLLAFQRARPEVLGELEGSASLLERLERQFPTERLAELRAAAARLGGELGTATAVPPKTRTRARPRTRTQARPGRKSAEKGKL